jgi:transposase-like protein
MKELKEVYKAPTEEAALMNLDQLELDWGKKYSLAIKSWRNNWDNLATFFKYPEEIRTVIYTTNAVEPPCGRQGVASTVQESHKIKITVPE